MTASDPADPAQLLGPPSELTAMWLDEVRRRTGAAPDEWANAAAVVARLLGHLGSRLAGRSEPLDDVLELDAVLGLAELVALRTACHRRAAGRLPVDVAFGLLHAVDGLIDDLLSEVVGLEVAALEAAVFIDPLTGVGNRRALDRDLARELGRSLRHGRPLSIGAIDVDGLKRLNDTLGHGAGDDALRRLAAGLSETLRLGDAVYRVGGDEFVVVLPETAADDVPALLDRARAITPAFSIGVATAPVEATIAEELLALADARLLEGRHQRRSARPPEDVGVIDLRAPQPWTPPRRVPSGGGERLAIEEISVSTSERSCTVTVSLQVEGTSVVGRSTGSGAGAATKRIVAEAVLDAATKVDPALAGSYVDAATVVAGEADVAVVHLVLVGDGERTAVGAASVRARGPLDASARAAMDALNRRLSGSGERRSGVRGQGSGGPRARAHEGEPAAPV
jgi:diguanylate cyclase (GGDEF)-like protein